MWSGNLTRPCCHLKSELQYTSQTVMKTHDVVSFTRIKIIAVPHGSERVVGLLASLSALLIWCLNDEVIPFYFFQVPLV